MLLKLKDTGADNSTVLKESWHIIWGCRLLADRHGTVEYTLLSTASRQIRSLRG